MRRVAAPPGSGMPGEPKEALVGRERLERLRNPAIREGGTSLSHPDRGFGMVHAWAGKDRFSFALARLPMLTSLRARWTVLSLSVALIPFASLVALSLHLQRTGLARSERELELAVVDRLSVTLSQLEDDSRRTTEAVATLIEQPGLSDDNRIALMQAQVARASELERLAFYDSQGKFFDAIAHEGASPTGGAPLTLPAAQAVGWQTLELPGGVRTLVFAQPLVHGTKRTGWLLAVVSMSTLNREIEEISNARLGGGNRALVLDRQGKVLAGGSVEGAHDLPTLPTDGIAMTQERVDSTGERMVTTTQAPAGEPWALFVRRPEAEAYLELTSTRRTLLIATGVLAALALALGLWLGGRATRPVLALVELTRRYARRVFEARSSVRTHDELEELGHSLEGMADSIAAGEREIERRIRVETGLSRYLPKEVAQAVARGERAMELGGERKRVTVLFADVASFTPFAERSTPEKTVALLNELFAILSEVVFRHQGMVDKYLGDCIMAVFGVEPDEDQVLHAIESAEDMLRFVEASAASFLEKYDFEVKLGIGLSTGEALVGNLGGESRMEFTAIGDVVNIASRLESLARPQQALLTAEVAKVVRDEFPVRSIGEHLLRGKSAPIELFELSV